MLQNCMNFDGNTCIGNNTLYNFKTNVVEEGGDIYAHFCFADEFGLDTSPHGSHHLIYDSKLMNKIVPSYDGVGFA